MKCFAMCAALVGALLLSSWMPVDEPGLADIRPNVIVFVLDDIGVDKLAAYGPPVPTPPTPQISKLAANGVRFTKAYSNPLCSPTRATVMTGRFAFRTGMGTLSGTYPLPLSEVSLAELLKNGFPTGPQYVCGAFGKWHLTVNNDLMHAVNQGFDQFSGAMQNVGNHYSWTLVQANLGGATSTQVGSIAGPFDETTFTASVQRKHALAWINAQTQPFLAYIAFNPPHAPFQVPPLTTVSTATANTITSLGYVPGQNLGGTPNDQLAYEWLIEAVDTEIGRVLAGLSDETLKRTTVLVVGDNGTPVPVIQVPPFQTAHAKGTVYEQGTVVPLVGFGYGVNRGGLACSGLVNTVDVWRTVAALTGAQLPFGVTIDGVNFRPMLRNPSAASLRSGAFVQLYNPNGPYVPNPVAPPPGVFSHDRAMTDGAYKYVRHGTSTPTEEAYDLLNDPLELNDLWPILATLPPSVQGRILNLKNSMISLSGF